MVSGGVFTDRNGAALSLHHGAGEPICADEDQKHDPAGFLGVMSPGEVEPGSILLANSVFTLCVQ
jgi:hypothetical protein